MWFKEKKLAHSTLLASAANIPAGREHPETPAKQDAAADQPQLGADQAGISPAVQHPKVSIIKRLFISHYRKSKTA